MSLELSAHADLPRLYHSLIDAYGPQHWWPARERFEILIGAVLVQNTAWQNVERAIANLRERHWLQAAAILQAGEAEFTEALRPSGTFRVKAARLRNLCVWFEAAGGFAVLDRTETEPLRRQLLSLKGVGPETADAILLYAFERPVFVVDAYTRRLLTRLGWLDHKPGYEALRGVFELTLPADVYMFAQYHALIVEHAKRYCRARPRCSECVIRTGCKTGLDT